VKLKLNNIYLILNFNLHKSDYIKKTKLLTTTNEMKKLLLIKKLKQES